jgi:SAM-dependent methyltransferase
MDPTRRFSNRVENYIHYRPSYPPEVLHTLQEDCVLTPQMVIADIGSGTGILTELFLRNGNRVFGVEPNREMRQAGERLLQSYPRFTSVAASAEHTTLPSGSVDFVTAGQAFHWFDARQARQEFARILKPGGWVVLIWNERQVDTTPFLQAYERLLLDYGTDYDTTRHRDFDMGVISMFFGENGFHHKVFANRQVFDYQGLKGRLLSSSYTPEPGHPNFLPMLAALERIFQAHQQGGKVAFEYNTKMYYGHLSPAG